MSEEVNWEARFKSFVREMQEIDLGIYPAAWEGKYEKRTERMDGWNEAAMELGQKIGEAAERASADADEDYALLASLDDDVFIRDGEIVLNMNDTWGWACADAERVPAEHVAEVARLFRAWGRAGLLYWTSKQRNWMRSEFKDINRFVDFVRREEEWEAAEPNSSARAYKDIPSEGFAQGTSLASAPPEPAQSTVPSARAPERTETDGR